MIKSLNKKEFLKYLFTYTLLYVFLLSLIIFFYYSKDKSLVSFYGDGFRQHFRAILYSSEYYRTIIKNVFTKFNFIIPQWDFSIGEGNDILHTFHYYGLNDIFTLFSIFFDRKHIYLAYDLIIALRIYFAGLSFSYLCFYTKKRNILAILVGALLYAFSGFNLVTLSGHTFFLNATVYLPLIICGIEKIINNEKPWFLSIFVFLSSISNIYFFYMNVILTITYVIVRLLLLNTDNKNKIQLLIKISLYSILGLMMSFVVFLPMSYALFTNSRLSQQFNIPLLYQIEDYKSLLYSLAFSYNDYYGNYSLLIIFALTRLFTKKDRLLIILFAIGIIYCASPFVGALFNAMTYPTTRWLYGIGLLIIYIIVDYFDDIKNFKKYDLLIVVAYYAICSLLNLSYWQIYVMYTMLSIGLILFSIITNNKFTDYLLVLSVLFCIAFSIIYRYSPIWWNYANNGTDINNMEDNIAAETEVLNLVDDKSFWRFGCDYLTTNSSVNSDHYSTQFYWSIANSDIVEYRENLGLLDHNNHHYDNYDDRFILNQLSATKYYICNNESLIPYNFINIASLENNKLLKNNSPTSFVYVYDEPISKDKWDEFNLIQKQDALIQKAVIETDNDSTIETHYHEIPFEISAENIDLLQNRIVVKTTKGYIEITPDSKLKGEYYLVIEGLECNNSANLSVSYENINKTIFLKDENNPGYANKHDFAINLGYSEGYNNTVKISIPYIGDFKYNKIYIVCLEVDKLESYIEKLNNLKLNKLEFSDNKIFIDLTTDKDKILFLSLPYSKGWKAKLDGKNIQLQKINVMYTGLNVEAGNHQLELKYSTPLHKEGLIISIIGFAIIITIIYKDRKAIYEKD